MEPLSRSEFVHFILETLSQASDALSASEKWSFDEQRFSLRKGHAEFLLNGPFEKYSNITDEGERKEYFKKLADVIRWIKDEHSAELNFDDMKDKIFPTIRMTVYYDSLNAPKTEADKRVNVPFPGIPDLRVGFFINNSEAGTSVTNAHQKAWAKSTEELMAVALKNLNAKTPRPPQWKKGDAVYEVEWNDEFCAARVLLLDLFDRKWFPQTFGDLVILIPADDRLLATGAMDQLGLIYMGDTLTDYDDDDLLTDIALRLTEQNGNLVWQVYEPRDGEGRIPENERDVEIMWESLKAAAKKMAADKTTRCNHCGTISPTLKKCSQCQQVWYCTRECQKMDWKLHKPHCKKP